MVLPLTIAGAHPAIAFPNSVINLKDAIERQSSALKGTGSSQGYEFGIFGSVEIQTGVHKYRTAWQDVLKRIELEKNVYKKCDSPGADCSPKIKRWREKLASLRDKPVDAQLASLNRFVNGMATFTEDSKTYGKPDYWATPTEFFRGRADCEDYAAVKFWSLLELGYTSDQLRLAVVKDQRRRILHAVVTVETGGRTIVLDSLFDHPVEQRYVLKYAPVFSANVDRQWVHIVTRKIRVAYLNQLELETRDNVVPASAGVPNHSAETTKTRPSDRIVSELPKFVDWT